MRMALKRILTVGITSGVARRAPHLAAAAAASASTVAATAAAAADTKNPKCVLCRDGDATLTEANSKQWLLASPNGAYTTARTCANASRLFEWETHVQRTADSAAAMLDAESALAPERKVALLNTVGQADALRPRLDATVAAAVRRFVDENGRGDDTELKLTVLVSWDVTGGESQVACHVQPLPPLPKPPVRVEVRGMPRTNAAAKDSAWVAERAPLEALKRDDINELLLVGEDGELLEGSQTNFYALVNGAVHTAGEGILMGTVRRLLIEVCEREGIPVVLSPPNLADADKWEGALISSTSRLALPIDEIFVPSEGKVSELKDRRCVLSTGDGSLAANLQRLVALEVEAHSTPIAQSP